MRQDELAEAVNPEPVWDERQYYVQETWEWFSDWEYYSDDYFDGKPPSTGEEDSKATTTQLSEQALKVHNADRASRNDSLLYKKRKHSEAVKRFLSDESNSRQFRGIVYRDPSHFCNGLDRNYHPDNLDYKPGKSDKCQLFYDWRHPSKKNQIAALVLDYPTDDSASSPSPRPNLNSYDQELESSNPYHPKTTNLSLRQTNRDHIAPSQIPIPIPIPIIDHRPPRRPTPAASTTTNHHEQKNDKYNDIIGTKPLVAESVLEDPAAETHPQKEQEQISPQDSGFHDL